jgi:hypothetical protein
MLTKKGRLVWDSNNLYSEQIEVHIEYCDYKSIDIEAAGNDPSIIADLFLIRGFLWLKWYHH